MKIHVLFTNDGNIIAAIAVPDSPSLPIPPPRSDAQPGARSIRIRPKAGPGQSVAVLTVPREHEHPELLEVCKRMKVEKSGDQHVLKMKE